MKVTLRALRVNRGLTQKEAAERLNITPRTLQYWEMNRTFPTTKQLMKICEAYECGIGDIFLPKELG